MSFFDEYVYYNAKSNSIDLMALPDPDSISEEEKEADESVNFNNICRACLSTDNELVELKNTLFENLKLYDIYNQYLSMKVKEDDDLPQQICTICLYEISRIYLFIKNCRDAEDKLNELVKIAKEEELISLMPVTSDANEMEFVVYNQEDIKNTETHIQSNETIADIIKLGPIKVQEPGPPYICCNCSTAFDSLLDLKLHRTEKKHYIVRQYKCRLCVPSMVYTYNWWKRHVRVHTGEKPFVCEVCGKRFSVKQNLNRHIIGAHSDEKPYHCDICNRGFTQSSSLKYHLLKLHNIDNDSKGSFKCKLCNSIFDTKAKFNKHTLNHYGTKLVCGICGKCFNSKTKMEVHMEMHRKIKQRDERPGRRKRRSRYEMGGPPYICEHCGRSFKTSTHLTTHYKTHTGEKPFECRYCGRKFALNGNLVVHVRMHTGENPYKCELCGKAFPTTKRLKYHRVKCDNDITKELEELLDV